MKPQDRHYCSFYLFSVFRIAGPCGPFYDRVDALSFIKPWARPFVQVRRAA